ncbi:LuxR C-terminal-related transcriptional regulator [Chryseobacterium oryctis]|uniref:LuxR C-terminal-related transcriptional regulator n=1 Tax=Chryseobacterium oryctis TaxID=2952618 RepID=A0ABT3HK30_9FLAO|nr:LuxR C-terminal-related transcriptional regulator [Chryseobacterium oryctis]MCW3160121.1 LuxR C-terminal-related transcriptional regulator [Chryseobacterium oryctis]
MKSKQHQLTAVWNEFPDALSNNFVVTAAPAIQKIIAEMFSVGNFYYYIINVADGSVSNFNETVLSIHGLKEYPNSLQQIIDLIHPDDIPFVLEAERLTLDKMKEIGFEHQLNLKTSYCFRMKVGDGSYQLFHHQAIHSLKDENGKLLQAINIHTNIHHLTQQNNFVVVVSGIGTRDDYHQILVRPNDIIALPNLTKREKEILSLIGKGYSGAEIAKSLILSEHTIRTHRKNILAKTNSRNSKELVRKAFEWGLI